MKNVADGIYFNIVEVEDTQSYSLIVLTKTFLSIRRYVFNHESDQNKDVIILSVIFCFFRLGSTKVRGIWAYYLGPGEECMFVLTLRRNE
jgi:hypothetical protein